MIPDTPAGKVLAKWLQAFNSGDKNKMLAFMEVHDPEHKDWVERFLDFREDTGGFTLLRIGNSEPRKMQAFVKETGGDNQVELQLAVNDADPAVITQLSLNVVRLDEGSEKPTRLTEAEAVAGLEKEAAARAAKDTFSGTLLVAKHGKVLIQKAYGLADREKKAASALDTQYRIGSMNKMFTSVAALQLVEAGKLSLDKPIGEYLKDYPNKDVASKVTVRHLLSHTGGTGDIFGPEFEKNRLQLRTLNDYVKLYGNRGLKFEPGAKWECSNYGFLLAGVLIEMASGMSYYDYVREKVFKPTGMTMTDSLPEEEPVNKRSIGYMRRMGNWVPNTDTLPWRGTSACRNEKDVDCARCQHAADYGRAHDLARHRARAGRPPQRYTTAFCF